MKRLSGIIGITLLLVGLPLTGIAAETGHYVNGVEGIKAATLPPPGRYYRMYNTLYLADTLTDGDGDELNVGFDATVFANVHRFLWVTDYKILGADYGADFFIPLLYQDIELSAFGISGDEFGLGDIVIEPFILAWHGQRYDAVVGAAAYLPTGNYKAGNPASLGKGFWTAMFSFGGTWYPDAEKLWSASILGRYEVHFEKEDTDITPGNDFHFEWGVGRTVKSNWIWDIGLAGYCQWQVSDDSGADVAWDKGVHDQVYAVGPHVSATIPSAGLIVSLLSEWEFAAEDRPEGNVTTLSIIKPF